MSSGVASRSTAGPGAPVVEAGDGLASAWLVTAYAALLELSASLPSEDGVRAVARRAVDGLAAILPGRAVGICVVLPDADAPLVEMHLPSGVLPLGRDPTRLFPELRDEWVVDLPALADSTLHVATGTESLREGSMERDVVGRAAALVSRGLRTAIAMERSRPPATEVAELRAQLIQAEKLATLGQLVAGVVHELANPVTSIVACTDYLLRKGDPGVRSESDHLTRISLAADRILKFSRDLVAYTRPASEETGPVPVHEIIMRAHAFSEHELERRGIAFSADFEGGAPPVLGQAGPLTQVFVNLFTNAAHAMTDHGGRLSVRTRAEPGSRYLHVDVTDTGTGISPDILGKIFEAFFTTKDAAHGTGLGLSIVREIVQAHGGTVTATSTLGEGTTFTVGLPLVAVQRTG